MVETYSQCPWSPPYQWGCRCICLHNSRKYSGLGIVPSNSSFHSGDQGIPLFQWGKWGNGRGFPLSPSLHSLQSPGANQSTRDAIENSKMPMQARFQEKAGSSSSSSPVSYVLEKRRHTDMVCRGSRRGGQQKAGQGVAGRQQAGIGMAARAGRAVSWRRAGIVEKREGGRLTVSGGNGNPPKEMFWSEMVMFCRWWWCQVKSLQITVITHHPPKYPFQRNIYHLN